MESEASPQPAQNLQEMPSSRFRTGLEIMRLPVVNKPAVEGLDNLKSLDNGKRAIFATTHLSDADPTIAAAVLAKYRDLDIASLQTNQKAFGLALRPMGLSRFHDVANTFDNKRQEAETSFDSSNYEEMKNAMDNGRDMVIAAHKPTRDWKVAKNAGVGDVYLSHLTGAPVIPVAVDIHTEKPVGMSTDFLATVRRALLKRKPDVTVRIGKPISFSEISKEDLEIAGQLLSGKREDLRKSGKYEQARLIYDKLRQESEVVLSAISDMLPPEKRRLEAPGATTNQG